jgi:hypothetical protein
MQANPTPTEFGLRDGYNDGCVALGVLIKGLMVAIDLQDCGSLAAVVAMQTLWPEEIPGYATFGKIGEGAPK